MLVYTIDSLSLCGACVGCGACMRARVCILWVREPRWNKAEYGDFHVSVCRMLSTLGGEEFDERAAWETMMFDFENDSGGKPHITHVRGRRAARNNSRTNGIISPRSPRPSPIPDHTSALTRCRN